jgi:type IV pilus assembly protein PilB
VDAANEINEERIRNLAEKHGMLSMRDSGLERIREGQTSLEEVAYATTEE